MGTIRGFSDVRSGMVLLAVVLSVASFAGMLRLKTDVEQLVESRRVLVERRAALQEERLILLAELAYLANPQRLRRFAESNGYIETSPLMMQPLVVEADDVVQ